MQKGSSKLNLFCKVDDIILKTNSLVCWSPSFLRHKFKRWVTESCWSKILPPIRSQLARTRELHWSKSLPTNGRWNQYLGHLAQCHATTISSNVLQCTKNVRCDKSVRCSSEPILLGFCKLLRAQLGRLEYQTQHRTYLKVWPWVWV